MQLSHGQLIELLAIGTFVGFTSGMLGIGGGVVVVPALVLLLKFTQVQAVGTSLAMLLPPIGVFAVMAHYQQGNVNMRAALMLACGFAGGGYLGAKLAGQMPDKTLRMLFAFFLVYLAGTMMFRAERRVWAVLQTIAISAAFGVTYFALHALGKRWERPLHLSEEYQRRLDAPLAPDYQI